jgi:hypothetical protein
MTVALLIPARPYILGPCDRVAAGMGYVQVDPGLGPGGPRGKRKLHVISRVTALGCEILDIVGKGSVRNEKAHEVGDTRMEGRRRHKILSLLVLAGVNRG